MNSQELVLAACEFRPLERIPRFDTFWEYPEHWRECLGPPEGLTDVEIWVPDETPFPSTAKLLEITDGWIYEKDGWGRIIRHKPGTYYNETIRVDFPEGTLPDAIDFESPGIASRYLQGCSDEHSMLSSLENAKQHHCVFGKTGGPYLRTTYVRGEEQFLMDIARDPVLAHAFAEKITDHLIAIGVNEIQRWSLHETGIWIFDDIAYNNGPFFSPKVFERIFLPLYRKMVNAFKVAGARYVIFHSDGDIRLFLDMLLDAGIDGINPIEPRAHMDASKLRKQYPRLILVGGMDNTRTLIHGPISRIKTETCRLIDLGRDGGLIIGTHSISPEVPLEHFVAYNEVCLTYGYFKKYKETVEEQRL